MQKPPPEIKTTTERLLWALLVAQHGDLGALRVWENLYDSIPETDTEPV